MRVGVALARIFETKFRTYAAAYSFSIASE